MEQYFDLASLKEQALLAQAWLFDHVFVLSTLVQLLVIVVAYGVARLLAPKTRGGLERAAARWHLEQRFQRVLRVLAPLTLPVVWLLLQWLSVLVMAAAEWPHDLLRITVSLITAWVIIRFASQLVQEPTWARVIATVAWTIAALNILGLLDDTVALLDSLAVQFGDLRLSALAVIKGILVLTLLLWLAVVGSSQLDRRIKALPNLTPTIQVLFSKLLKITLIVVAIVLALRSVGIDLSALALFSGAIGLGIGFGLQKAVSNLISGIMLLMDRSIKPGDVIAVGDTVGWINALGARYVSVVTRDGIEHLIPNEDFITQRVENWSYTNEFVRLKIPIGVSYNTDVRKARELCLAAAEESPRVLAEPKPVCHLTGFGDSSVDLELRVWIDDPPNGLVNVKSDVLLRVWDKFHEHDIEIPFPQRDLHLKPPVDVTVRMAGARPDEG